MRVPYKCTQPYDGGPFDEYPERRGWKVNLNKIYSPTDFHLKNIREIESFFQTWLYFGTLHCVFALAGVEVHDTEFVTIENGVAYVTFDKLLEKIELWSGNVRETSDAGRDSGAVEAIQGILSKVIRFVQQYGDTARPKPRPTTKAARRKRRKRPFSEEISLSIVTLASLLVFSGRLILSEEGWPSVDLTVPLLQARFDEMGWCKADIGRLFREFNTNGYYYMALEPSPNKERNHSKCDDRLCQARNIDEANYATRHIVTCDGKDVIGPSQVDDLIRSVVKIIDADGIPVVALEAIDGSVTSIKVKNAATDQIPYVAISHVWGDGLGNPVENALPKCQLFRIQSLVDNVLTNQTDKPTYFWMDTLCVPVATEYRPQRQKSILKMRDIYILASSVLVLDNWIQQLPVSSGVYHKAIRLFVSNWIQRLWTLQESMMAENLYIQFQGGAHIIGDIIKGCKNSNKSPADVFSPFGQTVVYFGYLHYGPALRQVKVCTEGRDDAANSLWFAHLSRTLGQRATSHRSDETICLATTLAFDVNALIQIKGSSGEETADKRMEKFLTLISGIPKGMIFHTNAHLTREGFRWAPNTFMGGRTEEFWRDFDKRGGVSRFEGRHLRVVYPGMLCGPMKHTNYGREFLVCVIQIPTIRCYKVKFSAIDGDDFKWEPGSYIGIITGESSEGVSDAVLGVVKTVVSLELPPVRPYDSPLLLDDVTVRCEGKCVVKEIRGTEGMDPQLYVPGRMMSEGQAWLVL